MPSEYKSKKLKKVLKKLENSKGIEIIEGGNHTCIKAIHNGNKFPIPCRHPKVSYFIIRKFQKWLINNRIIKAKEIKKYF
jgi:hypothetical protein